MDRSAVIEHARSYIGTRWKHQGRTREGVDCVGLIVNSMIANGKPVDDFTGYTRRPSSDKFLTYFLDRGGVYTKKQNVAEGDILIFSEKSYPCHVGFYSIKNGNPHLLHAHLPKRKVVEEPFAEIWHKKLVAVITLPEYN